MYSSGDPENSKISCIQLNRGLLAHGFLKLVLGRLHAAIRNDQCVCQVPLLQALKWEINQSDLLDGFWVWSEHIATMKTTQRKQQAPSAKPGLNTQDHIQAFLEGGYFNPENEASGNLQCMGSAALAAVARGELDLNALAIIELAARGQDENAKWVGFDKAREIAAAKLAQKGATK